MTLRPAQVKDLLIEHLREAIASGRLPAGKRLTELRLAEGLGVSRTPVREALHALSHLGIITQHESGRGFEVRGYSLEEIKDVLYVRAVLEGAAAERVARHPSDEAIARLRDIVERERMLIESDTYPPARQTRHVFHSTVMELAGSRELQAMFDNVFDKLRMISTTGERAYENRWNSHHGHHAIVEAIAAGDPNRARELMVEHCEMAMRTLMQDPVRLRVAQPRPLQQVLDGVRDGFADTV